MNVSGADVNSVSGVLVADKPAGISSHTVVNRVRTLYGTKSVGHCGTLDPMATGVLLLLIGRAVKASEFLKGWDKDYTAGVTLGIATDSFDITGRVLSRYEGALPSFEEFEAAALKFKGGYMQLPPMYSAVKVGGVKLVKLARKGLEAERTPRRVEIAELVPYRGDGGLFMRVSCSGGTYIRALCDDIGRALGCGAVMSSLRRTRVGGFGIESAHSLDELSQMSPEARKEALLPVDELFSDCRRIFLPPFFARLFRNGCEIYFKKLRPKGIDTVESGVLYRVCDGNGFFALGESRSFPDGMALAQRKIFFR